MVHVSSILHTIDITTSGLNKLYTAMWSYYTQGTSPVTQRSYKAGIRQYHKFCRQSSLRSIPTFEKTILLFSTHLAIHGLSYATIKVYLSAVRHAHVTEGYYNIFDSRFTPRVQQLLKGIRKESSITKSTRKRLPITMGIMQKIKHLLTKQPATYQSKMLWADCCVAFFGFLRVSEFTVTSQHSYDQAYHLSLADLTLDNRCSPTTVQLCIKQSKTDPYREGASVFLSKTNKSICPVDAIVKYLIIRGKRNGPLFLWPNGMKLTRPLFASALANILRKLNISPQLYNTQSFCIRAATSANQAGLSPLQIKTLGRWLPEIYQTVSKSNWPA